MGLGWEVGEGKDIWMKSQETTLARFQGNVRQIT